MRRLAACSIFFAFVVLGVQSSAFAMPEVEDLIQKAERLELQNARYWKILLHYQSASGREKSFVDDDKFFLSPAGKTDPKKELEATIRTLFAPDAPNPHPRCRFPARFEWLVNTLEIDPSSVLSASCPELEETLAQINPQYAVLAFPSAFMNSPASMFGHAMIRIDSEYENPLLSYAVTYAANVDSGDNGISYAYKGIFGFYPGYYSLLPYYEEVKLYTDMEQRDIAEYQLNLSQEEVRRMVLHILELKDIYLDYYFIDENCSYNMLFLLEAARPAVHLADKFKLWVTPLEVLEAVIEEDLVASRTARPSKARRIRHIASLLSPEALDASLALIENNLTIQQFYEESFSDGETAGALDIASEYIQINYNNGSLGKEEFQKRYLDILSSRSRIKDLPERTPVAMPPSLDSGHRPSRAALGLTTDGSETHYELRFRPVYHDLLDPDAGYENGSQLNFGKLSVGYDPNDKNLWLKELKFIDIVSLSPRDVFFKPVSWKVQTGFWQKAPGNSGALAYGFNAGGGFAWSVATDAIFYVLSESEINISSRFDRGIGWGLGASTGILGTVTSRWKINLQGRALSFVFGEECPELSLQLDQNFKIGRNHSLGIEIGRRAVFGEYKNQVSGVYKFYF